MKKETVFVAFSWADPDAYLDLATYLRDQYDIEFYFVTDHPRGKLRFLQSGVQAFTMHELCAVAPPHPDLNIAKGELDHLVEYDRIMNWDWFPPERVLAAYSFLLDALQPNAVLTWNGVALLQQAPVYLAKRRGIPCFFVERGLLPGTLAVDPEGINYGSHIAGDKWKRVDAPEPTLAEMELLEQYRERLQTEGRTIVKHGEAVCPQAVRRRLNISPGTRIVLFPLQIETDSNILYCSPYYKEMPNIIRDVQQALENFDETILIVKPHPEDRDRVSELQAICGARTRLSADLSLHSLLDVTDVVVTVNSTVGLEALIQRKPVVVLGRAVYGEKGFTFDVDEPSRLSKRLKQALDAAEAGYPNEEKFYRFLLYLLKNCLFSIPANDMWDSRENIAGRIITASAETKRHSGSVPPVLAWLLAANATLMRWLGRSCAPLDYAGGSEAENALYSLKDTQTASALLAETAYELAQSLVTYREAEQFIRWSLPSLGKELQVRQVVGDLHVKAAFSYYEQGKRTAVRQHLARGIWHNPRWLRNRSVLSIGAETFLGPWMAEWLRKVATKVWPK